MALLHKRRFRSTHYIKRVSRGYLLSGDKEYFLEWVLPQCASVISLQGKYKVNSELDGMPRYALRAREFNNSSKSALRIICKSAHALTYC